MCRHVYFFRHASNSTAHLSSFVCSFTESTEHTHTHTRRVCQGKIDCICCRGISTICLRLQLAQYVIFWDVHCACMCGCECGWVGRWLRSCWAKVRCDESDVWWVSWHCFPIICVTISSLRCVIYYWLQLGKLSTTLATRRDLTRHFFFKFDVKRRALFFCSFSLSTISSGLTFIKYHLDIFFCCCASYTVPYYVHIEHGERQSFNEVCCRINCVQMLLQVLQILYEFQENRRRNKHYDINRISCCRFCVLSLQYAI